MDSYTFIHLSTILLFLLQTVKGRLSLGHLQERWDLEVQKEYSLCSSDGCQDCAKIAFDLGLRKVKAYVKGPGNGRESAIRTIHGAGIEVTEIIDVTPLPHNGCRPPKRRRV